MSNLSYSWKGSIVKTIRFVEWKRLVLLNMMDKEEVYIRHKICFKENALWVDKYVTRYITDRLKLNPEKYSTGKTTARSASRSASRSAFRPASMSASRSASRSAARSLLGHVLTIIPLLIGLIYIYVDLHSILSII